MTDFWNLKDFDPSTGEFDAGGGDFEPIPSNTTCLAIVDEAKWQTSRDGFDHISLRWSVLQPEAYKNRKIFQKLWVTDDDPSAKDPEKKREKARMMLAAIDANAGGKLRAAGGLPTDELMGVALTNKPMLIRVMMWKIKDENTDEIKTGNWIGKVSSRNSTTDKVSDVKAAAPAPKKKAEADIPF